MACTTQRGQARVAGRIERLLLGHGVREELVLQVLEDGALLLEMRLPSLHGGSQGGDAPTQARRHSGVVRANRLRRLGIGHGHQLSGSSSLADVNT